MAVIKTYGSSKTADAICAKLNAKNDGLYEVVHTNGKYAVMLAPTVAQPPSTTAVLPGFGEVELKTETHTAPVEAAPATEIVATQKVLATDTVTIEIEGAKLTAQYVITPVLGSRPRWFERKRLQHAEAVTGGVRVTCSTKELTSRGLGHLLVQLDTKANEPEVTEEQHLDEAAMEKAAYQNGAVAA